MCTCSVGTIIRNVGSYVQCIQFTSQEIVCLSNVLLFVLPVALSTTLPTTLRKSAKVVISLGPTGFGRKVEYLRSRSRAQGLGCRI